MLIRKLFKAFILLMATGLYLFSATNIDKGIVHNISIDMSTPLSIIWPFEIAVVGDEGERGLRIGSKIGRGWCGEAGGEATYRFYVPSDGTYHIWAYALWHDNCTNAIFAKIDDMEKTIIGNDPIYNQWHWVRGFSIELQKGTRTLHLSNHSDNIALQKVFFANSAIAKPDDAGKVFSDIFYDGFDGCDQGNFSLWEQICGKWEVYNPFAGTDFVGNVLVGSSKTSALIILNNNEWPDHSINISVRSMKLKNPQASVGICFGVKDQTDYCLLKWGRDGSTENVRAELVRRTGNTDEVLTDFVMPWKEEYWHEMQVDLGIDQILIHVGDEKPISVPIGIRIVGGIGFCLEGEITAYFDNIHVRQVEN